MSKCIVYNCFYFKVILDTCFFLEEPEKQKDRLVFIFSDVCSLSPTFYSDIEEVTTNISILYLDFLLKNVSYCQTLWVRNVTPSHHHIVSLKVLLVIHSLKKVFLIF